MSTSIHLTDYASITSEREQAHRRISALRGAIAAKCDTDPIYALGEDLANMLNDLAEAEGVYRALVYAEGAVRDGGDPYAAVVNLVQSGPSDTWSGRTNDVRRANFEGLLTVMGALRYVKADA